MESGGQSEVLAAVPSIDAVQADRCDRNSNLGDFGGVEQPADGGAAAWKILCAAFMFEALLFGECRLSLRSTGLVEGVFTYWRDYRVLGFLWCFSGPLWEASSLQRQFLYTYCRDNGVWHTISWRPCNGCRCETLSAPSTIYHLDWLAAMYPRTYRRLFCEQSWYSHIYPRYHVWL